MSRTLVVATAAPHHVRRHLREGGDVLVLANAKNLGEYAGCRAAAFHGQLHVLSLPLFFVLLRSRPRTIKIVIGDVYFHDNVVKAIHRHCGLLFLDPVLLVCGPRGDRQVVRMPYRFIPALLTLVFLASLFAAFAAVSNLYGAVALFALATLAERARKSAAHWDHRFTFSFGPRITRKISLSINIADHVRYLEVAEDPIFPFRNVANLDLSQEVSVLNTDMKLHWRCRTDGEGRRISGKSDSAEKSILMLGCSHTFGHFINDDETYASLVQNQFPAYAVFNYGTSGYSLFQMLQQLTTLLRKHAPRIVIVGYHADLKFRTVAAYKNLIYNPWGFPAAVYRNKKIRFLGRRKWSFFPLRDYPLVVWLEFAYNRVVSFFRSRPKIVDLTAYAIVSEMKKLCDSSRATLLLLNMDNSRDIGQFCKQRGISWCAGLSPDDPSHLKDNTLYPIDLHFNARAHGKLAESLVSAIRDIERTGRAQPDLGDVCRILKTSDSDARESFIYPVF